MVTHSSILAWGIPWAEEPGDYSTWGRKKLEMTERLTLTFKRGEKSNTHLEAPSKAPEK